MSSLPIILSVLDDLDQLARTSQFYEASFGHGIDTRHIHRPQTQRSIGLPLGVALAAGRLGERRAGGRDDSVVSSFGRDGLKICMDVQDFKPNELSVKVMEDSVVVEGKQEEQEDDQGSISRHFVRRYALPKDYDADKVISSLSSDGILTITMPSPQNEDELTERIVQIQQTGTSHWNVRQNAEETPEKTTNGSNGTNGIH